MNVDEKVNNERKKTLGKQVSKGVIRPTLNTLDISLWDCSNGPLKCKKILSSKINALCYMKFHGFHGNTLSDFKE